MVPKLETIEQVIETEKRAKKLFLVPILLSLGNILFFNLSSHTEQTVMTIFLWLTLIYFFLLFTKYRTPRVSLIFASILAEVLVLITYFTGSYYFNNILLIFAYTAGVSLVLKRFDFKARTIVGFFLFMTLFDILFVWLLPVIPALKENVQALLFTPLIKVEYLTLGSGDIIMLLLAVLTLVKNSSRLTNFVQILVLSSSILIALAIKNLPLIPDSSFPFLIILLPIFLLLYLLSKYCQGVTLT